MSPIFFKEFLKHMGLIFLFFLLLKATIFWQIDKHCRTTPLLFVLALNHGLNHCNTNGHVNIDGLQNNTSQDNMKLSIAICGFVLKMTLLDGITATGA